MIWLQYRGCIRTLRTHHYLVHCWSIPSIHGVHVWNRTWTSWRKCKELLQHDVGPLEFVLWRRVQSVWTNNIGEKEQYRISNQSLQGYYLKAQEQQWKKFFNLRMNNLSWQQKYELFKKARGTLKQTFLRAKLIDSWNHLQCNAVWVDTVKGVKRSLDKCYVGLMLCQSLKMPEHSVRPAYWQVLWDMSYQELTFKTFLNLQILPNMKLYWDPGDSNVNMYEAL